MTIRAWVDEGMVKMARYYGHPAENGFAGEAAAAVWVHIQEVLYSPPAPLVTDKEPD
jgi:hypothetical protein